MRDADPPGRVPRAGPPGGLRTYCTHMCGFRRRVTNLPACRAGDVKSPFLRSCGCVEVYFEFGMHFVSK